MSEIAGVQVSQMKPGSTYFKVECTNCKQLKRQGIPATMISAMFPGGERVEHFACTDCGKVIQKHNLEFSKRIDKENAIRERYWKAKKQAEKDEVEPPNPPTQAEIDAEIDGQEPPKKEVQQAAAAPAAGPSQFELMIAGALEKMGSTLAHIDERLKAVEDGKDPKPRRTKRARPD